MPKSFVCLHCFICPRRSRLSRSRSRIRSRIHIRVFAYSQYSPSPSPSHSNSPVTFAVLFLAAGGALTQFVYILNTNTKISSSLDCLFNSIKIPRKKFQSCIIYKCELRSFNKLNWHCHWPHPLPHSPPPKLNRNDNILTNCLTNAATEGSIIFQLATDKSN